LLQGKMIFFAIMQGLHDEPDRFDLPQSAVRKAARLDSWPNMRYT
jgi:hypothetical protein